eukprot:Hpha_TRINITY_DN4038_c0_g1::TRINITY_DN4038_c0_g1_i1::g.63774::m.63774
MQRTSGTKVRRTGTSGTAVRRVGGGIRESATSHKSTSGKKTGARHPPTFSFSATADTPSPRKTDGGAAEVGTAVAELRYHASTAPAPRESWTGSGRYGQRQRSPSPNPATRPSPAPAARNSALRREVSATAKKPQTGRGYSRSPDPRRARGASPPGERRRSAKRHPDTPQDEVEAPAPHPSERLTESPPIPSIDRQASSTCTTEPAELLHKSEEESAPSWRRPSSAVDEELVEIRKELGKFQRLQEEMELENKRLSAALREEREARLSVQKEMTRQESLVNEIRSKLNLASTDTLLVEIERLQVVADPQIVRRHDSEVKSAQEETEAARQRVRELTAELERVSNSVEAIRLEHEAASRDFIRVSQSNSELRKELRGVTGDLSNFQQRLVAQDLALAQRDQQIGDLSDRAERNSAELLKVRDELHSAEARLRQQQESSAVETGRLRRELTAAKSSAEGRLVGLELGVAERQARIVQQDYDIGTLRSRVSELEFEIQALTDDNAELARAAQLAYENGLCERPSVGGAWPPGRQSNERVSDGHVTPSPRRSGRPRSSPSRARN